MISQLTSNAEALRLFFTEDIYLVNDKAQGAFEEPVIEVHEMPEIGSNIFPKKAANINEEKNADLSTAEEPKIIAKTKFDFKYLGKNQRNILILVNDSENEVSTEQGRELLRKLVNAITLTAKDFALVNYANYITATYADFDDFFDCKLVLAFGVNAKQLALPEQTLHQLKHIGKTEFIFTTNLHDLDTDQLSKKLLWTSLQQLK